MKIFLFRLLCVIVVVSAITTIITVTHQSTNTIYGAADDRPYSPSNTGITNATIIAEAAKCDAAKMDAKVFYAPALNDAGFATHVGCIPRLTK